MLSACHATPSANLGSSLSSNNVQSQLSAQGLTNLKVLDMGHKGGSSFGLRFEDPQDIVKNPAKYGIQGLGGDVAEEIKWFVITLARTGYDVTDPYLDGDQIANHRGQQIVITRGESGFTNCGGYFTNVQPGDYFLQIAALVPDYSYPDDFNKGFNVARSLNISDTGYNVSDILVPTSTREDFITAKFRLKPPTPGCDPNRTFIKACLGLQAKLVNYTAWDGVGVGIALDDTTAQVWGSSREGLLNGHFATGSNEPVPYASPYPCPTGDCNDNGGD